MTDWPLRQWVIALTTAVLMHFALGWLLLDRELAPVPSVGHAVTIALASSGKWSPSIIDPVQPEFEAARASAKSISAVESQLPVLKARRVEERSRVATLRAPAEQALRRSERHKPFVQDTPKQPTVKSQQRFSGAAQESDKAPVPISGNPRPLYPIGARRRGHQGRVHLEVVVSASGAVTRAAIKKSSGHRSLDKAALQAVVRWQFRPGERAGKAAEHVLEVPIVFRLRSAGG